MTDKNNNLINPVDAIKKPKYIKPVSPKKQMDLRDTQCPLNFVKAKLELEKLQPGQILEVWLCEGESVTNVPQSLKLEGHEVLKVQPVENYYIVQVKKV